MGVVDAKPIMRYELISLMLDASIVNCIFISQMGWANRFERPIYVRYIRNIIKIKRELKKYMGINNEIQECLGPFSA